MGAETKLEVRDLTFTYHGQKEPTFSHVNFSIEPGEIFVILGANGAGKSTLLNCIADTLVPQRGEILINGRDLREMSAGELALAMGYVPQISSPSFSYLVRDYIVMGRAPHMGLLRVPGEAEYTIAEEIMDYMGIRRLAEKRQRVKISNPCRMVLFSCKTVVQTFGIISFAIFIGGGSFHKTFISILQPSEGLCNRK